MPVKMGHDPATVNGGRDGASGCESGNLPGLVEAGTLREKECGDEPRYSREAFLFWWKFAFGSGVEPSANGDCGGGVVVGAQAGLPVPLFGGDSAAGTGSFFG